MHEAECAYGSQLSNWVTYSHDGLRFFSWVTLRLLVRRSAQQLGQTKGLHFAALGANDDSDVTRCASQIQIRSLCSKNNSTLFMLVDN
jgi:hypothetical protein